MVVGLGHEQHNIYILSHSSRQMKVFYSLLSITQERITVGLCVLWDWTMVRGSVIVRRCSQCGLSGHNFSSCSKKNNNDTTTTIASGNYNSNNTSISIGNYNNNNVSVATGNTDKHQNFRRVFPKRRWSWFEQECQHWKSEFQKHWERNWNWCWEKEGYNFQIHFLYTHILVLFYMFWFITCFVLCVYKICLFWFLSFSTF